MILQVMKRLAISDGDWKAPTSGLPSGRDMQRYLIAAMVAAVPCLAVSIYYFKLRIVAMGAVAFLAISAVVTFVVSWNPLFYGVFVFFSEKFR